MTDCEQCSARPGDRIVYIARVEQYQMHKKIYTVSLPLKTYASCITLAFVDIPKSIAPLPYAVYAWVRCPKRVGVALHGRCSPHLLIFPTITLLRLFRLFDECSADNNNPGDHVVAHKLCRLGIVGGRLTVWIGHGHAFCLARAWKMGRDCHIESTGPSLLPQERP